LDRSICGTDEFAEDILIGFQENGKDLHWAQIIRSDQIKKGLNMFDEEWVILIRTIWEFLATECSIVTDEGVTFTG
jgi:hypothetical protein